jgi:hypothetical protein
MVNLIKLYISTIRWGKLSIHQKELVKSSKLSKIFKANYIHKTPLSQNTIVTLE